MCLTSHREPPVAVQGAHAQTAASLLAPCLEADETDVQGTAEEPAVDLGVNDGAGFDVEQLRCPIGHQSAAGTSSCQNNERHTSA
jgi:hypothetical protein